MSLEDGYRLRVAPRFAVPADWGERLRKNSGVIADGERFFPKTDWTALGEQELARLVAVPSEAAAPGSAEPIDELSLFAITDQLRTRFWTLLDESESHGADWFMTYANELTEFARFKRLPLPPTCGFSVTLTQPGQPSTRLDGAGAATGLSFCGPGDVPRVLGMLNLGDEPSAVVFALRRSLDASASLLRILLRPGEGVWFPAAGLIWDGDTRGRTTIDAMLVIAAS